MKASSVSIEPAIHPFDLSQTYCQRTLREVKMLTRFRHENIIDLKDIVCEDHVDRLKVRE